MRSRLRLSVLSCLSACCSNLRDLSWPMRSYLSATGHVSFGRRVQPVPLWIVRVLLLIDDVRRCLSWAEVLFSVSSLAFLLESWHAESLFVSHQMLHLGCVSLAAEGLSLLLLLGIKNVPKRREGQ